DESDVDKFTRAVDEMSSGKVGLHLKVDTGMSRLGIRPERLDVLIARIASSSGVELTGLCTHFASAEHSDATSTEKQIAIFEEARARVVAAGLEPVVTHASNSAATARFPQARYDLVRPGLALY